MSVTSRPTIERDDQGGETIRIGGLLSTLLAGAMGAGVSAMIAVGVLNFRADAAEEDVEELQEDVENVQTNQVHLDRTVRSTAQDVEWSNKKLDALLEAQGVTKRIDRPPLPPSTLE